MAVVHAVLAAGGNPNELRAQQRERHMRCEPEHLDAAKDPPAVVGASKPLVRLHLVRVRFRFRVRVRVRVRVSVRVRVRV